MVGWQARYDGGSPPNITQRSEFPAKWSLVRMAVAYLIPWCRQLTVNARVPSQPSKSHAAECLANLLDLRRVRRREGAGAGLPAFIDFYKSRPHRSLNGQPPMSRAPANKLSEKNSYSREP